MGLTTQYLKYHPVGVFGVVTSSRSPPVYLSPRLVATGCNENVLVWNVSTGLRSALLQGESSSVTFISRRPNTNNEIAVGYQDGTIAVYNVDSNDKTVVLQGHKRAVHCMTWNSAGTRLASGGMDCEIIVWDMVEECGLFRLKGHKEKVTGLEFLSRPTEETDSFLVSTSADRTIKIWELATQHCQVTNIHHKAQVNAMTMISDLIVCASDDPQLRLFKIDFSAEGNRFEDGSEVSVKYFGSLGRSGTDKTTFITVKDHMIFTHGLKNNIDIWMLNNEGEIIKRTKKRLRKLKRDREGEKTEEGAPINEDVIIEDRIKNNHLTPITITCKGKLKGIDLIKTKSLEYKIVTAYTTNQLQVHQIKVEDRDLIASSLGKLSLPGHREAPRVVQFSEDNRAIVTGSNDSIKVWSVETCKCVRTVQTAPITCIEYCKGDRQVIAGAKNGNLLIFDIASAEIIQEIEDAHQGEIWQIKKHKGDWATVGTDGDLKLWKLDFKDQSISMSLKRTLKLSESALAVEFTNDKKFIAVALLDNTVKVFYRDTLKFWNSIYGHQLPVNCLAASEDSTLLVTGSGDRTVKLWGMDFADCHKSFVAHDKAVTSVAWVFDTHLFFSMSKDGEVKQWDGDAFQLILKLSGHKDEINAGVVSFNGDMVCTVSKDKSIRLWERSEDLVVLEEEEQKKRDEEAKAALQSSEVNADLIIPGVNPEAEATINQVHPEIAASAAERLIESIEIHNLERARSENEPKHPILMNSGLSSFEYVLQKVNAVHQQELESALLLLPIEYLLGFMGVLCDAIEQRKSVERATIVLNAIQRLFLPQLTASGKYARVLERAQSCSMVALDEMKSVVDFNFAILSLLQDRIDSRSEEALFTEALTKKKKKDNKRLKKAVLVV